MSPSEFDLRAALRDGEGDGPDPDAILAGGRARASARRTRILGVTGAVVAVLAVGTTGAIVLGRGDGNGQDTAGGGAGPGSAAGATGGSASRLTGPQPSADSLASDPDPGFSGVTSSAAACPTSFPTTLLPGGGGTGGFGSGGALFTEPVASVLVCGYGASDVSTPPGTVTLLGGQAQSLVTSLEGAATRKPSEMCPDYRTLDGHRFAFIGLTSDGTALAAVTTTVGGLPTCDVKVTNGTAIRYAWAVPAALATPLTAATPK